MVNAIPGTVPLHLLSMGAGARDMASLGMVRSTVCCYRTRKWNLVMCAALSGSGTEDAAIGEVVSKPRRFPR